MDEYIADAYIDGGKTGGLRLLHDGSTVDFRGGHTKVRNPEVLLALLRREDVEIHPTHRYKDSYPYWLDQCPYNHPAKARIVTSDGFVLSPDNNYTRPSDTAWWSDVEPVQDDNPFEEEVTVEQSVPKKPGRPRRVSDV